MLVFVSKTFIDVRSHDEEQLSLSKSLRRSSSLPPTVKLGAALDDQASSECTSETGNAMMPMGCNLGVPPGKTKEWAYDPPGALFTPSTLSLGTSSAADSEDGQEISSTPGDADSYAEDASPKHGLSEILPSQQPTMITTTTPMLPVIPEPTNGNGGVQLQLQNTTPPALSGGAPLLPPGVLPLFWPMMLLPGPQSQTPTTGVPTVCGASSCSPTTRTPLSLNASPFVGSAPTGPAPEPTKMKTPLKISADTFVVGRTGTNFLAKGGLEEPNGPVVALNPNPDPMQEQGDVLSQLLTIVGTQPAKGTLHFASAVAAVCAATKNLENVELHLPVGERKEVLVTAKSDQGLFELTQLLQNALLGPWHQAPQNEVYVRGYMNPGSIFQPATQGKGGYEAILSYVPPEDVEMACWDMHQKGFCPRGIKGGCRWRHPSETLKFRVALAASSPPPQQQQPLPVPALQQLLQQQILQVLPGAGAREILETQEDLMKKPKPEPAKLTPERVQACTPERQQQQHRSSSNQQQGRTARLGGGRRWVPRGGGLSRPLGRPRWADADEE